LAKDQGSAALSGAVYKPAPSPLSTGDVNNRRIARRNLAPQGGRDFKARERVRMFARAVLEPQSCDVLVYMGTESPDARGGGGRFEVPGKRRHSTDANLPK